MSSSIYHPIEPTEAEVSRFAKKVKKTESCWLWLAATDTKGYGQFYSRGRQVAAHGFAYAAFVGPIPDGLQLDHVCRVHNCVNPAHLEPVSCRENVLRGVSFCARNAAKTCCPAGHQYNAANTYVNPAGARNCRTCLRDAKARYNRRRPKASRRAEMRNAIGGAA